MFDASFLNYVICSIITAGISTLLFYSQKLPWLRCCHQWNKLLYIPGILEYQKTMKTSKLLTNILVVFLLWFEGCSPVKFFCWLQNHIFQSGKTKKHSVPLLNAELQWHSVFLQKQSKCVFFYHRPLLLSCCVSSHSDLSFESEDETAFSRAYIVQL